MFLGLMTRGRLARATLPPSLGLLLAACPGEDPVTPTEFGITGELAAGNFLYLDCLTGSVACRGTITGFPDCVAAGSRFSLGYEKPDGGRLAPAPVGNTFFSSVGSSFYAQRDGTAAFTVSEGGSIRDFLHIRIVELEDVELRRLGGPPNVPLVLRPGRSAVYGVFPRSRACSIVGGLLPVQATSSDLSVADVSGIESLRVFGIGPGTATISVTVGRALIEFEVTVEDPPQRPEPPQGDTSTGGGDETGGSSASATESGGPLPGSSGDSHGSTSSASESAESSSGSSGESEGTGATGGTT